MKKEEIKFDRRNFRKHSKENKRIIRKSLEECGAGRSVLIDADGELIAGNGVYEQAEKLGIGVKVVETDGTELVVVKRTDLHTEDEKRKRLAFADNASSDNVEWNVPELTANIDAGTLDDFDVKIPVISENSQEDEDAEIERKKREFAEKMAAGELDEDDPEYQEFLAKFEEKKTTDDCYTPEVVYDAVADWVANEYNLSRANFVRPFYPGGDYQKERYKKTDIVVDNPPFSILSQIIDWYNEHGVHFFLFAPHLTLFSSSSQRCACLPIGVQVTYANGAKVNTSFITNLEQQNIRFRSEPRLYAAVKEANDANLKELRKELPKYFYPKEVIMSSLLSQFSRYGIDFVATVEETTPVDQLDAQKAEKKSIFGKGYFLSDRLVAEREKAEREKAEREKAEREKAERGKATVWELSDRERAIIAQLNEKTLVLDKEN